jgi:hypothetical protein
VLRIVVVACCKCVKPTGQAVDGRIVVEVIIIGKDDVEVAVELGRSKFMEVFRYEREAYEVGLGALHRMVDQLEWAGGGIHLLEVKVETNMG